jgi:hypothetical protein
MWRSVLWGLAAGVCDNNLPVAFSNDACHRADREAELLARHYRHRRRVAVAVAIDMLMRRSKQQL